MSLREAARATNLSLAATHRILCTLKSVGALCTTNDGTYTLGPRLLKLHEQNANARRTVIGVVRSAHDRDALAAPAMSVRLSVLDMSEIFIFAGVDNGVSPKMRSEVGAHYEAYCTAPGKVLLAGLSGKQVGRLPVRCRVHCHDVEHDCAAEPPLKRDQAGPSQRLCRRRW